MGFFTKLDKSVSRVDAMTSALGVDPVPGLNEQPELAAQRYRGRIFRCSTCDRHESCGKLLETGGLTEAPNYCLNKADFDLQMKRKAA